MGKAMFVSLTTVTAGVIACLVLTPIAGFLARKINLLDRPDSRRKLHKRPIPTTGGLAVFLSVTVSAVLGCTMLGATTPGHSWVLAGGVWCAAAWVCFLGVIDDYKLLRGRHKLVGQLLAAVIVIAVGVRVEQVQLFGWVMELGMLAVPFTIFFLLGAINALNLIDGMDGLLSSIGVIVAMTMAIMTFLTKHYELSLIACALTGSLLGFLWYNFPPASIFLGNSGSMLTGLLIGVLAIQTSLKGPATIALVTPTALLIIPILDTTAAIVRRKLTGRSIYVTDRAHLHHCLQNKGWTAGQVLLLTSCCCLVTGIAALLSLWVQNETLALTQRSCCSGNARCSTYVWQCGAIVAVETLQKNP